MAKLLRINPANGDKETTIFDSNGEPIGTLQKGDIVKIVGSSGGFYQIQYKPKDVDNTPLGGTASTGITCGYPYTLIYADDRKRRTLGYFNNGTPITVNDTNEEKGLYQVTGLGTNGMTTGWVEGRFLFRDRDVMEDEEE